MLACSSVRKVATLAALNIVDNKVGGCFRGGIDIRGGFVVLKFKTKLMKLPPFAMTTNQCSDGMANQKWLQWHGEKIKKSAGMSGGKLLQNNVLCVTIWLIIFGMIIKDLLSDPLQANKIALRMG